MSDQYNSFNEVLAEKQNINIRALTLRPCQVPLCSNKPLQIFSLPQLIKSDLSDYEGERKKQEREEWWCRGIHILNVTSLTHTCTYWHSNLDSQCCLGRCDTIAGGCSKKWESKWSPWHFIVWKSVPRNDRGNDSYDLYDWLYRELRTLLLLNSITQRQFPSSPPEHNS